MLFVIEVLNLPPTVDLERYGEGIALHCASDMIPGDHPRPYVAGGAVLLLQTSVMVVTRRAQ